MIKKILDWILGKNDSGSTTTHPLDGATRTAQERAEAPYKVETPLADTYQPVETPAVKVVEAPVVEATVVTVKAKFKKTELNKMTKKELLDLAAQHGVAAKARAAKADLVKALSKV
jgi:hypothetical protein